MDFYIYSVVTLALLRFTDIAGYFCIANATFVHSKYTEPPFGRIFHHFHSQCSPLVFHPKFRDVPLELDR